MSKSMSHIHPDFQQIPPEGLKIEVMETITGIKGLGLMEFARNRFDPFLTIYDDHLDLNVVRIKQKPYQQIERIILLPRKKPYALRLHFIHDLFTFSATILDRELLLEIHEFILRRMRGD